MKILCTICARKNSKGLKNKNIKKLRGIPLISRTLLQAKKSKLFEDVVVSTDSEKIQFLSKKLGINTWFLRPKSLSNDKTSKVPVILHALKQAEKFYKKRYDAIIDLDVTAPLRTINDIKKAYNKFKKNNFDIIISVCKSKKNPYFNMIEIKKEKIRLIKKGKKINSRQNAPTVYDINASIYIWTRKALINKKSFFSKNTGIYVMPRERSVDIDDNDDWNLVNFYLKKMKNINYKEKFNLKNKTAFVVGGSGLIGKEVVYALADFGAKVIILDIKNNFKSLNNYNEIFFEYFDVAKLNQNENYLKKIIKKHKTPDIFINCSYPHNKNWPNSSFSEIKLKSIIENVNIHMNSYIWIARIVAENMKKNKIHGSIIQLGSTYGVVGQNLSIYKNTKIKENLTYSAIKGGIANNAKLMASYYGKYKIRVNCVCPGGLLGHVAGISKTQPSTFKKRYNDNVPLKRMGNPDEVASAILFLSTDAASYITGSTFMVDGGWTSI